ncbi:MAG: hypothetical protein AMK70_06815 [Nitrospira bacterium SG8_35_1]|nr:MAG: hypothetical protein AMK70_06815 [Nitrospira bacterium SG8_35_1]
MQTGNNFSSLAVLVHIFYQMNKEQGVTIILITLNLELAEGPQKIQNEQGLSSLYLARRS